MRVLYLRLDGALYIYIEQCSLQCFTVVFYRLWVSLHLSEFVRSLLFWMLILCWETQCLQSICTLTVTVLFIIDKLMPNKHYKHSINVHKVCFIEENDIITYSGHLGGHFGFFWNWHSCETITLSPIQSWRC